MKEDGPNMQPQIGKAVGDGGVNDAPVINAFITHPQVRSGSSLYFPSGKYRLATPLMITDAAVETNKTLHLFGDSAGPPDVTAGTWFLPDFNQRAIVITVASGNPRRYGMSLRNFGISCKAGSPADAIEVRRQANMRFDCLYVVACEGHGIFLDDVYDSVFQQVFLSHCGKYAADPKNQKAALFIAAPHEAVANNEHRFIACHFEHSEKGPLLVIDGPGTPTAGQTSNNLAFDGCKFEPSGRPRIIPATTIPTPSPLQFKNVRRMVFMGCRFSQYGRAAGGSGYCMTVANCEGIEVVAGLCVNDAAVTPDGFAEVIDSWMCDFEICGRLGGNAMASPPTYPFFIKGEDSTERIVGSSRGIAATCSDATLAPPDVRLRLIHFPPVSPIDPQRLATAEQKIVNDPSAPRGRALTAAATGSNAVALRTNVGGVAPSGSAGPLGITVFVMVRMSTNPTGSQGRTYGFFLGNAKLAEFDPANTNYGIRTAPLAANQVIGAGQLIIRSIGSAPPLHIAEVGWYPNPATGLKVFEIASIAALAAVLGWLLYWLFHTLGWL